MTCHVLIFCGLCYCDVFSIIVCGVRAFTHTGCVGVVLVMMFVIATVVVTVIVCKWYVKNKQDKVCMNINVTFYTLVSLCSNTLFFRNCCV